MVLRKHCVLSVGICIVIVESPSDFLFGVECIGDRHVAKNGLVGDSRDVEVCLPNHLRHFN